MGLSRHTGDVQPYTERMHNGMHNAGTHKYSYKLLSGIVSGVLIVILSACTMPFMGNTGAPSGLTLQTRLHKLPINAISWSPDGTLIASGSQETGVKIWNVQTAHVTDEISNFRGSTASVAWSPDGMRLAIGLNQRPDAVGIWESTTRKMRFLADPGPDTMVSGLSWSPDGAYLAVGILGVDDQTGAALGGSVIIYDTGSGRPIRVLSSPVPVTSVAWSPDGRYIATGTSGPVTPTSQDTTQVWEAVSGRLLVAFKHSNFTNSVAWSPDSRKLASGSADGTISIWDITTQQLLILFSGHSTIVSTLAWSPDGKYLASGSWDGTAKLWDASNWAAHRTWINPDYVNSVAWEPGGAHVAVGCHDGELLIWSVK